jgi:hypothetical protein
MYSLIESLIEYTHFYDMIFFKFCIKLIEILV